MKVTIAAVVSLLIVTALAMSVSSRQGRRRHRRRPYQKSDRPPALGKYCDSDADCTDATQQCATTPLGNACIQQQDITVFCTTDMDCGEANGGCFKMSAASAGYCNGCSSDADCAESCARLGRHNRIRHGICTTASQGLTDREVEKKLIDIYDGLMGLSRLRELSSHGTIGGVQVGPPSCVSDLDCDAAASETCTTTFRGNICLHAGMVAATGNICTQKSDCPEEFNCYITGSAMLGYCGGCDGDGDCIKGDKMRCMKVLSWMDHGLCIGCQVDGDCRDGEYCDGDTSSDAGILALMQELLPSSSEVATQPSFTFTCLSKKANGNPCTTRRECSSRKCSGVCR